MKVVYQALIERIRRVNVYAVGGNNVIVLQADAPNSRFSRIRLEIKSHPFLEDHRGIL
jgi:hypothetical protein